ncbi:hypothetical protein [Salininema proteolyticum]
MKLVADVGDYDETQLDVFNYDGVAYEARLHNRIMLSLTPISAGEEQPGVAVVAQCLLWHSPQVHLNNPALQAKANSEWLGDLRDAIGHFVRPYRDPEWTIKD